MLAESSGAQAFGQSQCSTALKSYGILGAELPKYIVFHAQGGALFSPDSILIPRKRTFPSVSNYNAAA